MENNIVLLLLKKLKNQTIEKKIIWKRISNNIDIYASDYIALKNFITDKEKGAYVYKNSFSKGKMSLNESYVTEFKGGYIFIFNYRTPLKGESIFLAVQSNKNSNLVIVNDYENNMMDNDYFDICVKLSELLLFISKEIDSSKEYIDLILNS